MQRSNIFQAKVLLYLIHDKHNCKKYSSWNR